MKALSLTLLFLLFIPAPLLAQENEVRHKGKVERETKEPKVEPEIVDSPQKTAPVSPKKGWGDFPIEEEQISRPWWHHALLWFPNRVVDLIDVFRVDAGVGASIGGVVRITKYGQVGYRTMHPGSLRIGDFGREVPVKIESSNEFGAGPAFVPSKDRIVCPAEVGLGVDLGLAAYGGICLEELVDFVAGIFFLDILDDDLK